MMSMDKDMYNHELYKDLYYDELDLKDKISNRTNFAFGILTLLIGALAYCYNKYLDYIHTNIGPFLCLGLILLSFCLAASIFFVFKSFFGYSYKYIPSANNIHDELEEFQKYYNDNKDYFDYYNKSDEDVINESIKRNMNKIIRESASTNREENLKKSKWLRAFSWAIFLSFFVLILNFGLIIYGDIVIKNKPKQNTTYYCTKEVNYEWDKITIHKGIH